MATGAYLKEQERALLGRKRIYTDADHISTDNIFTVLAEAFMIHEQNAKDISFLIEYEKGMQPLKRKKIIRPEIDIEVSDNLANQIVEFKLGYNWGNPITFVQKSNKDMSGNPPARDDDAITQLNEMNDAEAAYAKDQELARFVEICGIGYQMVDVKRDYDGGSVFDLHVLHPLYTFVIYRNNVSETPIMGVTYRETQEGNRYFTCYTADAVYEVKNLVTIVNGAQKREWSFRTPVDVTGDGGYAGELNPLGMVSIVEFVRAYDRMGIFERQISDMDALNAEVSDFANATAQSCQELWWGNDFEFPKDPKSGETKKPKSGEWVMTRTLANGTKPLIQPLSINFDYSGVQQNITEKRSSILQKCYVPLQSDPGGGSTANALSLSSGWAAAEASALKEEQIIRRSKMQIVALELAAVKVRSYWLTDEEHNAIVDLKVSDVYAKFTRQKTYDLGTKTNSMVAMIKAGINGRVAMQTVDLFADVAQAWNDSKDLIEKFQKSLFEKQNNSSRGEKREMADMTDQTANSPILDGMGTGNDASDVGGDDNA